MALATQCPHCQTTFRVVHDQLKLRAGLVRCGRCKQIFNGIEHLLPSDGAAPPRVVPSGSAPTATAAPATVANQATPAAPSFNDNAVQAVAPAAAPAAPAVPEEDEPSTFTAAASPSPASVMPTSRLSFAIPSHFEREHTAPIYHEGDPKPEDPLQRMTLVDIDRDLPDSFDDLDAAAQTTTSSDEPDDLDKAIDDLQRKPWRRSAGRKHATDDSLADDELPDEEPGFVRQHRAQRETSATLRTTLIVGCCLLALTALLQAGYVFRNQLAGVFPQAKPALSALCQAFGCRIDLPANISAVSIESSELQAQDSERSRFLLNVLLRNDSSLSQEWPSLELTLNDAAERPLLRRVFAPSEYLHEAGLLRTGFAANSERSARLAFELEETRASGYRVYLFYP
ncbi:membrane protein [Oxalicibacterium flavum]|uniref:Membrane protein n=1 Tax=Oxalicibacterium flavum TaxID=179467 RepID=A0A8J2XV34_9BURK|nr:DUF3426 domain-containing protein [Oxalicibacterium flavum]GGC08236.1 membrane protein [Oxalicibacterium flavum]